VLFAPHQFPWTVLAGELAARFVRTIVRVQPCLEVVRVADVKPPLRIPDNVDPIHDTQYEVTREWLQRQGSNLQPAG